VLRAIGRFLDVLLGNNISTVYKPILTVLQETFMQGVPTATLLTTMAMSQFKTFFQSMIDGLGTKLDSKPLAEWTAYERDCLLEIVSRRGPGMMAVDAGKNVLQKVSTAARAVLLAADTSAQVRADMLFLLELEVCDWKVEVQAD
jgi:hypothetical protein